MTNAAPIKHFGLDSIRHSLKYFLFGKGTNVFLSLAILFSLAGLMPQNDYAAFVSWQALILLVGLISTFGIQAVMHRYLPELRSNNNRLIYRLLTIGVSFRFLLSLMIVSVLILNLPFISSLLKVPNQDDLLVWFLLVGALRITGLSMSQACDALLWQRLTQISLVIVNLLRVAGILLLYLMFTVDLKHIILVELVAESLFLILLFRGTHSHWRSDQSTVTEWWSDNRRRALRYGGSKYLVNLSRIMYGSAPNRLLAAQFSSTFEIALLGFADSIVRLGRRFMPAILMIGFIRPVFIARYSTGSEFSSLVKMSNLIFRINLSVLTVLIAGVLVVGEPAFDLLTNNKYGSAYLLVAGFLILLTFEGLRQILELLIEVTELNQISIISNLVQSGSLLIAIPLFYLVGLWSIVIANIVGTILACLVCGIQLRRHNFSVFFEVRLVGIIILQGCIAWLAGHLVQQWLDSIVASGLTVAIVILVAFVLLPPLEKDELKQVRSLISSRKSKNKKSPN